MTELSCSPGRHPGRSMVGRHNLDRPHPGTDAQRSTHVYQNTGGEANGVAVPRHPRGLSPTGRLAAGVLLTLCMILLAPARPAAAHALLLASDPPNGATLATSPRVARMWFSEEIAANFRSVRLVDSTGKPIAGVSLAARSGNPRLL